MMPVLDLSTVCALAIDLTSPEEALGFLDRFQMGLPHRIHTIHGAFAARDPGQAAAALASLHSHALTVGALQLHAITGHALTTVDPDLPRAGSASKIAIDHRFIRTLAAEATLFTYAYLALRSNPTLLTPPRTGMPSAVSLSEADDAWR